MTPQPASAAEPLPLQQREWTSAAVAKLRAKLIDLSRASPLIAFKHSVRSASQLRIVDERPDLLFERLNNGPMGFEPLPGEDETPPDERTPDFHIAYERARLTDEAFAAETLALGDREEDARAWQAAERALKARVRASLGLPALDRGKGVNVAELARAHGFDPSFDLKSSDDDDVAGHHEDDRIRTLLTEKELDKRLKGIFERAGTHLRETGLHTLNLVFGFVEWFEDDASEISNHAPLLLLPVGLDRQIKRGRYEYQVTALDDGLGVNVAAIEKSRTHWGLDLPKLRAEETPESYFVRAREVLAKGRRLRLRTFATLAVLPPMVLWKDLDPAAWPEEAFARHRVLPGLLGASQYRERGGDESPDDIDDPAHAPRVPALITDADASQHRAIMLAAAGHDLAIEGPPGTGKSQTITNMIATALGQGKRVLFVAEKGAALRVVSDRLRAAGFGPLLLELHGDRASRTDVYDGLRERFAAGPRHDPRALEDRRAELHRHRALLRRYLSLLRQPLGALGMTAHALVWRELRLRAGLEAAEVTAIERCWKPEEAGTVDRAALKSNRERLAQFGNALTALDAAPNEERTIWAQAERLNPFDQNEARRAALRAGEAAEAVTGACDAFASLGVNLPESETALEAVDDQLAHFAPFACHDEAVVGTALHAPTEAARLMALQADWRALCATLAGDCGDPDGASEAAARALAGALAISACPMTAADAKEEADRLSRLTADLAAATKDVATLCSLLPDGAAVPVAAALRAALALSRLGALSPGATAMLSPSLGDAIAGPVIDAAERSAAEITRERATLSERVLPQAFDASTEELDDLAVVLESTGLLGRLFGGRYAAAKRRAVGLLRHASARQASAETLRAVASAQRSATAFAIGSNARALTPPMLWNGAATSFADLREAHAGLQDASSALAAEDMTAALDTWLGASAAERQRIGAACARMSGLLERAAAAGFSGVPLGELEKDCTSRRAALGKLREAAAALGVRPAAPLRNSDETIADRLLRLIAVRGEFDAMRGMGALAWVRDIAVPLDDLAQACSDARRISALDGPLGFRDLLLKCATPAALSRGIAAAAGPLAQALDGWGEEADRLERISGLSLPAIGPDRNWRAVGAALLAAAADAKGAALAADLLKYRNALADRGLSAFAAAALAGEARPGSLADLWELRIVSALLRTHLGGDGAELGRLGSLTLEGARRAFCEADKALHKLEAAAIVAKRLMDRPPQGLAYGPKSAYTELALLEHETALKRPRTPLRDVAHRASAALQALKPVWLMSPASTAQYIRPGASPFDLLIIDEASQMRPENSVSCVLRADQIVVVGDANQLPPSDHFQLVSADNGGDDDVGPDRDVESILDLANQKFEAKRKPRLRWHYRSQHESLIQFSNRQFYKRDLIVFPSPKADEDELLGVKCLYVPKFRSDTIYEGSVNQREAEVVIEEAFRLMRAYPEHSIGIVAMNAKQTELIQNEFDRLVLEDSNTAAYVEFFKGSVDEFFVKNLENVQGDERDIILISTVYGPGKDGVVRQNFGLMNREVGWRRLNVLVTRAKRSCRLVTSLRPDDIKLTPASSKGTAAFKAYLAYAHGSAWTSDHGGGEPDSDFEQFVADALSNAGYEIVHQVGVEGFRIDLGVRHPDCPVGFIAGVECDGATYHKGLSVRDRDHIRQRILEQLGWTIYRVWSTDWFADPARETAKLLAWLERRRAEVVRDLGTRVSPDSPEPPEPPDPPTPADIPTAAPLSSVSLASADLQPTDAPREPRGPEIRSPGKFRVFEAIRGRLYEVWDDERFLGEVEVIKRATAAPRLFGSNAFTDRSEYEGRIEGGDCFQSFDLYAALRTVAEGGLQAG